MIMNKKQILGILAFLALFLIIFLAFAGIDKLFLNEGNKISPLIVIDDKLNYLILTVITLAYPLWRFVKYFKKIK